MKLVQDLAEAEATGTRKQVVQQLTRVDLLVIEDLGMRHVPPTAAEDLSKSSRAAMSRAPSC